LNILELFNFNGFVPKFWFVVFLINLWHGLVVPKIMRVKKRGQVSELVCFLPLALNLELVGHLVGYTPKSLRLQAYLEDFFLVLSE
jgi:hypothetical protein